MPARLVLVVVAALALAVPAAASGKQYAIGGFSGGSSRPVAPGAPRNPYAADFLAGRPRIASVQVYRLRGRLAGRVRAEVTVSYPRVRPMWRALVSDEASYTGRVRVVFRRAGRDNATQPNATALPLGWRRQGGGRVVQRILLSKRASRAVRSGRGPLVARVTATARFDQFGDGESEETVSGRIRRAVRIGPPPLTEAQSQTYACSDDADLPSTTTTGDPSVRLLYSGSGLVHFQQPLTIRLCVWSGEPFDQFQWFGSDGGTFPTKTARGTLSAPKVDDGYVTVTYTPDAGVNGGADDQVSFAGGGSGPFTRDQLYDNFQIRFNQRPFVMRATGDSITAAWGYLGTGAPAQSTGKDTDFEALTMNACSPDGAKYSNKCSSNAQGGPYDDDIAHRFNADTGLSNKVSYAAQFADLHGIQFRSPDGKYQTYGNYAVSGGRPEHYVKGGILNKTFEDQVMAAQPDVTVLTLGANPLLANILTDNKLGEPCGGGDKGTAQERYDKSGTCMRKLMDQEDVYGRLRAVYRRLLDDPWNRIFVAKYPLADPGLEYYFLTRINTNRYPHWVIERLVGLINGEITRAVHDEAAAAKAAGKGDRLFLFEGPRFNMGVPGLAQVYSKQPGVACPTNSKLKDVDGESRQSYAAQIDGPPKDTVCATKDPSNYWFESLDTGMHLSKTGATQYANALDAAVKDHDVKLP